MSNFKFSLNQGFLAKVRKKLTRQQSPKIHEKNQGSYLCQRDPGFSCATSFDDFHVFWDTLANTPRLRRNDDMSSLKVSSGCCVVLFQDTEYGGKSKKVCNDLSSFGREWNDRVSSVKLERENGGKRQLPRSFQIAFSCLISL